MKAVKSIATLCILISGVISSAFAAEKNNWHVGSLFTSQKVNDRDLNTFGLTVGYQFNQYFSVQTRYSKGTSGSSEVLDFTNFDKVSLDRDIKYQGSILIKAAYPFANQFSFYGIAGYSKTKAEQDLFESTTDSQGNLTGVNTSPPSMTFTENGFTYGVGVDYHVTKNVELFIEYQVLPDWEPLSGISQSWDSINLGFNYRF
ncbi:porin family protein [Neptunicella marina]|uniref:Porin family protein n=1 Tax=Neptunicella marina TaxID=2125989 RepID=A0A8J6M3L8_9ALTE|nr:porin family protein [Neptunicella marina]MBC3765486.1 porin family protein [Neptunicella marina]